MRTEDDLRAALTALERHAPAAARVLSGSKRRSSHGLRSPRTVGWLAGIATAAALAGAVTTVTVTGGNSGTIPNESVSSPSGTTNITMLRAKLLAALSNTSDIVYEQGYTTNTGDAPMVQEFWYYPWQPAAGQQVHTRSLTYSTDGKLHQDVGETYVMPAPSSKSCGPPGWSLAHGDRISVDYVAKTWSDMKRDKILIEPRESPAELIKDTPTEHWTVRHTTLDGRAALELTTKGTVEDNSWDTNLWFDASTYLPLREVTSFGPKNIRTNATFNYQYLPASAANLAKVTPPIPSGFKQVAGSQVPATGPCISSKGEIWVTTPGATLAPSSVPVARPSSR